MTCQPRTPVGHSQSLNDFRSAGGSKQHSNCNVRNNRIAVDGGFHTEFPLGLYHSRRRHAERQIRLQAGATNQIGAWHYLLRFGNACDQYD